MGIVGFGGESCRNIEDDEGAAVGLSEGVRARAGASGWRGRPPVRCRGGEDATERRTCAGDVDADAGIAEEEAEGVGSRGARRYGGGSGGEDDAE